RRFPAASIEQALSIRRLRVSSCLAESIQLIKSRRAIGVRSFHCAFDFGAAASALRRSAGTFASGSFPARLELFLFIYFCRSAQLTKMRQGSPRKKVLALS